jgi:hypothetical protein
MAEVNVYYDPKGRTLTVWFGRPQAEYVCEETGEEVVLMKDHKGHPASFNPATTSRFALSSALSLRSST